MALFRRTAKGRHALGAAVTSIPSGPLMVPVAAAPEPPAALPSAPVAAREPDLASSIAAMLATGEAWAQDLEDFHAMHTPVAAPVVVSRPQPVVLTPQVAYEPPAVACHPPVDVLPLSAPAYEVPVEAEPVPVYQPPVQAAPIPVPAYEPVALTPPVVSAPQPSARSSLEAALEELLPEQPVPAASPQPPAPRVQLGFRDGTSTSLDPGSSQSRALEELAQTLTRRD